MTSSTPAVLQPPVSRNVQLLLESRVPARLAWVGADGSPLVVPIWFDWHEGQLSVTTFAGSRKLDDLVDGTVVALTIDTEAFPYRSLRVAGPVTRVPEDGLSDSYRRSAERYLGATAGRDWCARLEGAEQVRLVISPTRASESDMSDAGYLVDPVG
ncbi:MAG: pyridoxamine 5'-phosphate oxidase family protein [Actinomycetota bacterium]